VSAATALEMSVGTIQRWEPACAQTPRWTLSTSGAGAGGWLEEPGCHRREGVPGRNPAKQPQPSSPSCMENLSQQCHSSVTAALLAPSSCSDQHSLTCMDTLWQQRHNSVTAALLARSSCSNQHRASAPNAMLISNSSDPPAPTSGMAAALSLARSDRERGEGTARAANVSQLCPPAQPTLINAPERTQRCEAAQQVRAGESSSRCGPECACSQLSSPPQPDSRETRRRAAPRPTGWLSGYLVMSPNS
jgi:hypothetical protein